MRPLPADITMPPRRAATATQYPGRAERRVDVCPFEAESAGRGYVLAMGVLLIGVWPLGAAG